MTGLYIGQAPRTTLPWLGVLLLGIPAYEIWIRLAKADVASKDPAGKMSDL